MYLNSLMEAFLSIGKKKNKCNFLIIKMLNKCDWLHVNRNNLIALSVLLFCLLHRKHYSF